MHSSAIPTARRLIGWRLNVVLVAFSVLLSDLVVASIQWLSHGGVQEGSMQVGTLASLIIATVVVGVAGKVRGRIAKMHRQELEASYARAQSQLGLAVATARMLFWEMDLSTGALTFDREKLTWLGLAVDAPVATIEEWLDLVHPQDRPIFRQCFDATLQSGGPEFDLDYRILQSPGNWIWVHSRGAVEARDTQGQALVAVGGTINIMQRKLDQAELIKSETLLKATLAATDEGILMIGHDGLVLSANQRFLELWKVPESLVAVGRDEQLLAHVLDQLSEPEAFINLVKRLYGSDEEARDTLRFKDGRVFSRFTRAISIDGDRARIWCFKDITEQTQFQTVIAGSEQKLRSILDNVDACIYLKDAKGRYLFANRATCELWHTTLEDVIGQSDDQFFDEQTVHSIQEYDRQVFESGQKITTEEVNRTKQSGLATVYLSTKLALRNDDGSIYALCGISTDVTAMKLLNSQLEESNQFLSVLMEAIPIPIFYKDVQGRYLGFNRAYEQFMGRKRAELIDRTVFDIAPKELADVYYAQDAKLMEQGGIQTYESQVLDGEGRTRDVIFSKACLLNGGGAVRGLIGGILDITERKHTERSLQESEHRTKTFYALLRRVTDNVPDMIWAKGVDKRFLFANRAVCEQLLIATDTDEPVGKDDLYFAMRQRSAHPENPEWHTFGELCQDSDEVTLQLGHSAKFEEFGNVGGKLLYLDVRKAPLIGEGGEVIGVVGTARDITTERETLERLTVSALVLANSSEALLLADADNHIVDVNPAFTRITGYTFDEVKGRDPKFLQSGKQGAEFYRTMWEQIETTGQWQGEVWNRHKNGQLFAEWLTVNTLWHPDGSVHRRIGLFSDITGKKQSEELIWKQANFDQLTALPNRRMFLDRLAQDLKRANRSGAKLALMFLDIDRFKEINDTLGHAAGDLLLAEAAQRISACTRESDTVARLGGDEFTVILAELSDDSGVDRMASSILNSLAEPFNLGTERAHVSVSIGITLYPDDAQNQEDLLRNADQAMYVSKDAGRNRASYFTQAMQAKAQHGVPSFSVQ